MPHELENIFNRSLKFSLRRKKLLFVFPVLVLCGILIVLSHTIAVEANYWVGVSLIFFPTYICTGILMATGIPLVRAYHDEVKGRPFRFRQTIRQSWKLMVGISSFAVPIVLAYLVLWIVLGIFYLLKNIPSVGSALGVMLSFGPFLLILGSLVLSVIGLGLLFFLTPQVALRSSSGWGLAEELYHRLQANPFKHLALLVLGILPLLVLVGFLALAAALTGMTYFVTERTFAIAMQWTCIMIPFAALLSPAVVFFFNFAAESFVLLQKRLKSP